MTQYQTEKIRMFDAAMSTTSISSTDTSRAEKPISVADNATTFRIKPTVRTAVRQHDRPDQRALAVEQPQADACGDERAPQDNPAEPGFCCD